MNRYLVLEAAGLLLLLNSCAIGPKYVRPDAPMAKAFREELPEGWAQARPSDDLPRGEWWTIYNDPQLDTLEDQINISNQNVLAAEAQFRAAQASVRAARSAEFPTVTAAPSASRAGVGTAAGSNLQRSAFSLPVDTTYQVDIWGSIRRNTTANRDIAQASAAELESVRLLFQAELAVDYFQIQGTDAERKLFEATVKSYEQNVQLTQDRFDGGIATMADVALAKTQLETARGQLTDLQIQRAEFEHAVAVLTGKTPADLSIAEVPAQSPPPPYSVDLPSTLLERRPDIAAAERQVAAANQQIGIAKAALYPALTLNGNLSSQAAAIGNLLTLPSRFWSVGPDLVQSLFDAGKRHAQVQVTEANYDTTVAYYRQTVLTAFQQVEDSMAQLRVLSDEGEVVDRAVNAAQQSLDISTIQYRGGTASYLQVIDAQTSVLQNQRSAVNILTRRMVASVNLIQALGGGWDKSQLPVVR
jgi:NodT family efflux transporter outer membrane factor (OMF) lipoprotein